MVQFSSVQSLFDVVHPAFPLPTTGSPTPCGDMPEPFKFPSLDSCQKRFLWTHKEADLALHPVVGLELQIGDAWILFSISVYSPCFTAIEDNGSDKRLAQLELACKTDGVAPLDPV